MELEKVTKIYTLRHFGGASFEVRWCGQTLKIEFIAGRGAVGSKRSVYTTADRFEQDAIEHDPRFGHLIQLDSVYDNKKVVVEPKNSETTKVKNVRYTRRELEAMKAKMAGADADASETGAVGVSADAKEAEAEKAPVAEGQGSKVKGQKSKEVKGKDGRRETRDERREAKDERREARDESGETRGESGEAVADEVKKEKVEGVKTLNDAYDYFAGKGVAVDSEAELKDAMEKAGVEFPNLK